MKSPTPNSAAWWPSWCFEEILSGQTKVRHRDTKSDYEFNRQLDAAPYRNAHHDLTLEVLTPVGPTTS